MLWSYGGAVSPLAGISLPRAPGVLLGRAAGSGTGAMGSGGGLRLAAVLAAAVLCAPGALAGRVLSGECAAREVRGRIVSGASAGAGAGVQRS